MRRFIAGAKCPGCGRIDTLFLSQTDTDKRRQCVACGFGDALENRPADLPVTRRQAPPDPVVAVPVRIVDSGTAGKKP